MIEFDLGFELSLSSLAIKEHFLEEFKQGVRNVNLFSEFPETLNSCDVHWWDEKDGTERIHREIKIFKEIVKEKSDDEKFAFAITALEDYKEAHATQFSIIVHREQNQLNEWNAIFKVSQHYPKEKLMDIVRVLVEKNLTEDWNSFPLLALCRYYSDENLIEMVRLFIDKGVDVNCKTAGGWNALLTVCRNYKKENLADLVSFFIAKNIEINCKTTEGWNALLISCRHCKKENLIDIVQLLLMKILTLTLGTSLGGTPFIWCAVIRLKDLCSISLNY